MKSQKTASAVVVSMLLSSRAVRGHELTDANRATVVTYYNHWLVDGRGQSQSVADQFATTEISDSKLNSTSATPAVTMKSPSRWP